jgi:hypothetical protein
VDLFVADKGFKEIALVAGAVIVELHVINN